MQQDYIFTITASPDVLSKTHGVIFKLEVSNKDDISVFIEPKQCAVSLVYMSVMRTEFVCRLTKDQLWTWFCKIDWTQLVTDFYMNDDSSPISIGRSAWQKLRREQFSLFVDVVEQSVMRWLRFDRRMANIYKF